MCITLFPKKENKRNQTQTRIRQDPWFGAKKGFKSASDSPRKGGLMWVFVGQIWPAAKKGSLRVQGLCISPILFPFFFFSFFFFCWAMQVLIVEVCAF